MTSRTQPPGAVEEGLEGRPCVVCGGPVRRARRLERLLPALRDVDLELESAINRATRHEVDESVSA
jgi:hypothetical protein